MKTLLLDQSAWDLILDAHANIAVASDPYALAQDAASAIKLFSGELWYDTTQGVPYFESILGHSPPVAYMKSKFIDAAMTVLGVTAAKVFVSGISGRQLTGQVQITNATGQVSVATF